MTDREMELALIKKISAISQKAVVDKTMNVPTNREGTKSYAARSEQRVLEVLRPLFYENGVYPLIHNILTEYASENYIKIKIELRIYDLDTGYFLEFAGLGSGMDRSDKDAGKALTYAKKNAFLHLFNVVTGEDTDNHSSAQDDSAIREEAERLLGEVWQGGLYHKAAAEELGVSMETQDEADKKRVHEKAAVTWQQRTVAIKEGSLQDVMTMVKNFKTVLKK